MDSGINRDRPTDVVKNPTVVRRPTIMRRPTDVVRKSTVMRSLIRMARRPRILE